MLCRVFLWVQCFLLLIHNSSHVVFHPPLSLIPWLACCWLLNWLADCRMTVSSSGTTLYPECPAINRLPLSLLGFPLSFLIHFLPFPIYPSLSPQPPSLFTLPFSFPSFLSPPILSLKPHHHHHPPCTHPTTYTLSYTQPPTPPPSSRPPLPLFALSLSPSLSCCQWSRQGQ